MIPGVFSFHRAEKEAESYNHIVNIVAEGAPPKLTGNSLQTHENTYLFMERGRHKHGILV